LVEVRVDADWQCHHQASTRPQELSKVSKRTLGGARITRAFVPADVLEGRDAHDQIEAILVLELEHIGVDHSRSGLIAIKHRMTDAAVMTEHIADLEHAALADAGEDGPDDRDLHRPLVQPRVVVAVREVLVGRATDRERPGGAAYRTRQPCHILRKPARSVPREQQHPLAADRLTRALTDRRRPVSRRHTRSTS
jgi:hypothetical protein